MKRMILCCFLVCLLLAAQALAEPPAPQGLSLLEGIEFSRNQQYPVYSGPGESYQRAGNGKASVSTNDWIQVFGSDHGWLMIRYEISPDQHRMGYIAQGALLHADELACLSWDWEHAHLPQGAVICENPFSPIQNVIAVSKDTPVYLLLDLGEWVYFETREDTPMRAFVKKQDLLCDPILRQETDASIQAIRDSASDSLNTAGTQFFDIEKLLTGTWRFCGGAEVCGYGITFHDDGTCQLYDTDDFSVFPPENLIPFGVPQHFSMTQGRQDDEYEIFFTSNDEHVQVYTLTYTPAAQRENGIDRIHLGTGMGGGFYERYDP